MGIQFYSGLSNLNYGSYGSYRTMDIPKVKPEEIKPEVQQPQIVEEPKKELQDYSLTNVSSNKTKPADLENISLTFNKEEDFGYIGKDASIKSLDMEKAISDMKKDGILEEYQYFVGSSKNLDFGADGIVIPKNN